MTCLVVLQNDRNNKLYMGADSRVSNKDSYETIGSPKLVKRRGILFGYTGLVGVGEALIHELPVPATARLMRPYQIKSFYRQKITEFISKQNLKEGDDLEIIICINHKVFSFTCTVDFLEAREVSCPYISGSGMDVAWGAWLMYKEQADMFLTIETLLKDMIKVASLRISSCDDKVTIIHE